MKQDQNPYSDVIATDSQAKRMRLTADVLERMIKANVNPIKIIDKFYKFLDEHLKSAFPQNKCKQGCSHCCYVPAAISAIEALYIEEKTGHKVTSWEPEDVDRKSKEPCTFLKNNECSIYEHRPTVCRVFMTFDDPKICADESYPQHWVVGLQNPGEGGLEWGNVMYYNVVTTQTKRMPDEYHVIKDIRQYFKTEETR